MQAEPALKKVPDDPQQLDTEKTMSDPKEMEVKIPMAKLVESANIAKMLPQEALDWIGRQAVDGYLEDRRSREAWEQRNDTAIKLALQVTEIKSFPWVNCANVKFPLVTVAALQFLARMSILTKGREIAQCEVIGADPQGQELARARRISTHMSFQLVEEDTEWINDDEKAKFAASIMGCAFKKSYFDPVAGINVSEYVPAANLVVDYFTKTLAKSNRVTQVLTMTANDLQERVRRGVFLEMQSDKQSSPTMNLLQQTSDLVQGVSRPASSTIATYEILEQHCFLDLDGDGYQEPYIVFIRAGTAEVLRIVARYFNQGDVFRIHDAAVRRLRGNASSSSSPAGKAEYEQEALRLERDPKNFVVRIEPQQFFTKYTFVPSVDGGFYDLGFGALLGPVNEAVNTLINQQLDAGTMQVTAGGFLGRGVKLKGGKNNFDPFEWKPVDSSGDDLRKSIVPLPVNAPSPVLFQLLGILISYGEKVSGATDIMSGVAPGQNTPAETSRNTMEQGMKLFSGIYGRMHRSFKEELGKLYRLNQLYLDSSPKYVALSTGQGAIISHEDYKKGNFRVCPAADPEVVSEAQRQSKAMMVLQTAQGYSGYNQYLVHKEFLEAHNVRGIEQLLPDPQGPNAVPPMPNPKLEIEKGKLELAKHEQEMGFRLAVVELQQEADVNAAKISELQAKAAKLLAEANGVDIGHQIAAINAQTGAAKSHQEGITKALSIMQKTIDQGQKKQELVQGAGNGNNVAGSAGVGTAPSDAGVPLVVEGIPAGNT